MNEVTQVQKMRIFVLSLLVLAALLAGCSTDQTGETPEIPPSTPAEISLPSPEADSAVVFGTFVNSFNNKPVEGVPFLSKNLSYMDLDMPATISFSLTSDPRANYNRETGEFYFENVSPAENYVIVLSYGPGDIYVVRAEDSEYPRMISVEAGQSLDLGVVEVKEP